MKTAIVGLGLIGGSLALDLKENGFASEVLGVDFNELHNQQAMALGLVSRICSIDEACREADLIILAIPVNSIFKILPEILDKIKPQTTVTDVGSTKAQIIHSVKDHLKRKQYVSSHPMAGTEFSGPNAAIRKLFNGKAAVICNQKDSDPQAIKLIEKMYHSLEMRIVYMDSNEHDLHAAYVSHLSHISSFVLANTVLEKEKDTDAIFNLASGGFESTVRLAKSSPEMWAPIFEHNENYIAEALGQYIDRLKLFHDSIVSKNFNKTKAYMQNANEIVRVLTKISTREIKK